MNHLRGAAGCKWVVWPFQPYFQHSFCTSSKCKCVGGFWCLPVRKLDPSTPAVFLQHWLVLKMEQWHLVGIKTHQCYCSAFYSVVSVYYDTWASLGLQWTSTNQLIWHVLASTVTSEFFSSAAVSKDVGWTLQVVLGSLANARDRQLQATSIPSHARSLWSWCIGRQRGKYCPWKKTKQPSNTGFFFPDTVLESKRALTPPALLCVKVTGHCKWLMLVLMQFFHNLNAQLYHLQQQCGRKFPPVQYSSFFLKVPDLMPWGLRVFQLSCS